MGLELVGLHAVATIFVEGAPGTPEAFTEAERDATFLAVVKAELLLQRLSRGFSPNRFLQCSFFNTTQSVVIDPGFIPPPTGTEDQELRHSEEATREGLWMLSAMAALGFPIVTSAPAAWAQFGDALKARNWNVADKPRRGLIIFVTKFQCGWFAYAGANRIVIQFDWALDETGGFQGTGIAAHGLDNLDRVIAHEIGHLFGGLDEYQKCDPTEQSGPLATANLNCVEGNPAAVLCLMRGNSETLCAATVNHFGWVDTNADGFVDAAPPAAATSLFPSSAGAGELIRIDGSGLGETRSVEFVGVGAADFAIISDNTLSVSVPDGDGSDIDVAVNTTLGISRPSASLKFTYL